MALGRIFVRRLQLALTAAALAAVFALAPAASAQESRVPVTGLPSSLNAELRRLLREEAEPQSLFDARRQAERAAATVARLVESEGYYAAEVEPWAEGVTIFGRGVRVATGPLFIINSSRIDYLGAPPDDTTRVELDTLLDPLQPGVPAAAAPVLETEDALLLRLRAAGYPEARAEPVDALADGEAHTMDFAFQLQAGNRASFGNLRISGLERTRLDFVQSLQPWRPGERYSPQRLDEFRNRLAETGIFDSAIARLASEGQSAGGEVLSRDVEVELIEGKRRTIALGAAASTSEGAGVEAEWEVRNFSGRGDSITVAAQLATLQRRFETIYRRPHVGEYGRNVRLGVTIEDFETDAFNQTGGDISASVEEQLTPRLRGSLGVQAGYASIEDQQTRVLQTGRRDLYILSGTGKAEYIGVRDVLDPANGVRARVSIEPGLTYGDTTIAFSRLSGEASLYGELGSERLVGALRGRVGTIVGPNGAPPDRLFFAGGGGSVRGYEYQSLSPRNASGDLIGGRSLVEASAEVRWRAGERLGYVAFMDAGAAGPNVEPPIDEMRAGVGLGVRYYAGFGPLRADIAIPLDKRDGDADFQIYISIGQAF